MLDSQTLQLTLFCGGMALTGSVMILAFSRTDRAERERTGRRRMRRQGQSPPEIKIRHSNPPSFRPYP